MLTPILISLSLHDSTVFRTSEDNEYLKCNDQVYSVSIYLIILFIIIVAPMALLFIYYAIEMYESYYLRQKKGSQSNERDVEMDSMITKDSTY